MQQLCAPTNMSLVQHLLNSTQPAGAPSQSQFCASAVCATTTEFGAYAIEPMLWAEALARTCLDVLHRLRFMFYLVWPGETMFPSLNHVPRYVAEGKSALRLNETVSSLSQGIFQECLRIKVRSIEVLMYCIVWDNCRVVTLSWSSPWTWWLCYICVDFGFYWAHRIAHEVNFLWAIHQAHHSSNEFSIVSALRQAVLQPFTAWITYMPLALAIPPQVFLTHMQLSELYMTWLHTEIVDTLGPLEYVLNTPSHHRVHHGRNPEYIDKNYGGMLIVWDRLFDTFKAEDKNNPAVYGLVHPVNSFNPLRVQFHPWPVIWRRIRRADTFAHKLAVVFAGPGWRPGVERLGNRHEIPAIVRPVYSYNPPLEQWQNVYVVLHFALVLVFYHQLTLHQAHLAPRVLNTGVFALLMSITSLGVMLDNKRWYSPLVELTRCLLFFQVTHHVSPILAKAMEHAGVGSANQLALLYCVSIFFGLSILLMSVRLVTVACSRVQAKKKN